MMEDNAVLTSIQYKVATISDIFYQPNYITPVEERHILQNVKGSQASWKEVRQIPTLILKLSMSMHG